MRVGDGLLRCCPPQWKVEIRFGSRVDNIAHKLSIGNGKEEKIKSYSCV